jgi:hypothetical protein
MDIDPETQFDFWLGKWEASWGNDGKGTNHVERILDGKVVHEDFRAPDLHGISVSSYDPERKLWCQTWVDNTGTYLDFTGKFENGSMVLVRDAIVRGEKCQQRMVWYDIEASQFHWNWERSDDGGQTWRTLWQIHYQRISE